MASWNWVLLANCLFLASISAEVEYEKCEIRKYLLVTDFYNNKLLEIDLVIHDHGTRLLLEPTMMYSYLLGVAVDSRKQDPVIYAAIEFARSVSRITFDENSEPQLYTLPLKEEIRCEGIAIDEVTGALYCGFPYMSFIRDYTRIWEITNNSLKNVSFFFYAKDMKCRGGYLYIFDTEAEIHRISIPITSTNITHYQNAAILPYIGDMFVDERYLYWLETNRKNSSIIFQRDLSGPYWRQLPLNTTRKYIRSFTIDSEAEKLYYHDVDTRGIYGCVNFQSEDNCKIIRRDIGLVNQMEVFSRRHCETRDSNSESPVIELEVDSEEKYPSEANQTTGSFY